MKVNRSLLFIPGNNPGMVQNADVFGADGIIIDLEDSVALDEKDAARALLKEALSVLRFPDTETLVRINPFETSFYEADVEAVMGLPVDMILLPKADLDSIYDLDKRLNLANSSIQILVLIETAQGVEDVYNILNASKRVKGLMLGGEDLCVDLGCERTKTGTEIFYARSRVVNAAKALKKTVMDTPFTDTNDDAGLEQDTRFAKAIGFDGKAAINPRQIPLINRVFTPTKAEVERARRILDAKEKALKAGLGVFSLDGKMIDLPIIKRAEKILGTVRDEFDD